MASYDPAEIALRQHMRERIRSDVFDDSDVGLVDMSTVAGNKMQTDPGVGNPAVGIPAGLHRP
jgi:hypothetical protein